MNHFPPSAMPFKGNTMLQDLMQIARWRPAWFGGAVVAGVISAAAISGFAAEPDTTEARQSPRYAVIHRFVQGEGWRPVTGLVQDKHGNLYGANSSSSKGFWFTSYQRGCGLIYRLAPDGTETTVYDFSDHKPTRGCRPAGQLLLEDGALYGPAASGGKYGYGALWRLSFNGHYQVLHHFTEDDPWGVYGLTRGSDGALYGTSGGGGKNRGPNGETYGTVFRLETDGRLTVLYNFHQADPLGVRPENGLTLGPDGLLYGTADDGAGSGTVFRVEASGQLSLVHTFHYDEGLWLSGLTLGQDGKLYGSAYEGGAYGMGTAWRVATDGQFELLHSFNGRDGFGPTARPVQASDGRWYGTTTGNPQMPFEARSTLYRARFDGSEPAVLHVFGEGATDGKDPAFPLLVGRDGGIYGPTQWGGSDKLEGNGTGTVFRQAP